MCFTTEDSWKKEIATLKAQLAEARAERDVLLACRHGDQRCFECPDTTCCDNLRAAEAGGDRDAS